MGPLIHSVELRLAKLDHYYSILNEDPDWTSEQNRPRFSVALSDLLKSYPDESERRRLAEDFVCRWKLPSDHGVDDLSWSFDRWVFEEWGHGGLPRLHPGARSWMETSERIPRIVPPQLWPFEYDPTRPGATRELKMRTEEIVARVRSDIRAQAAALEEQAKEQDYKSPGVRHRGDSAGREFRKGARRLYRRGICGMSFDEIADLEFTERDPEGEGDPPHIKRIREMVRAWSAELSIPSV